MRNKTGAYLYNMLDYMVKTIPREEKACMYVGGESAYLGRVGAVLCRW